MAGRLFLYFFINLLDMENVKSKKIRGEVTFFPLVEGALNDDRDRGRCRSDIDSSGPARVPRTILRRGETQAQ